MGQITIIMTRHTNTIITKSKAERQKIIGHERKSIRRQKNGSEISCFIIKSNQIKIKMSNKIKIRFGFSAAVSNCKPDFITIA